MLAQDGRSDFVYIPLNLDIEGIMNQEYISNLISEAESLSIGDLGQRFVRKERRGGQLLVHQSVATMLLVKANLGGVTFWT
jgi:hypothetical protein